MGIEESHVVAGCPVCDAEARGDALPDRERVATDDHWRLAYATQADLPGWLLLMPRRHVGTLADLTDDEAGALGGWQVRAARALREVTGCTEMNVVQFPRTGDPDHLRLNLVPRDPSLPAELRRRGIFARLTQDLPVPADRFDALARRLRGLLSGEE